MTIKPRYNFEAGTEVTFNSHTYSLGDFGSEGYELVNLNTGDTSTMDYMKFLEYVKSGAMDVTGPALLPHGSAILRLKGLKFAEQLSETQQQKGKFHYAICRAMDELYHQRAVVEGQEGFKLSIRVMDKPENQKFIRPIVQSIFGERVYLKSQSRTGGLKKSWGLYAGRTLMKYYWIFEVLDGDDDPIAALSTLDHLKGYRARRITWRLRELMTRAWEEGGLDLTCKSPANVLAHLEMLINEENHLRKQNLLHKLILPSQATLTAHRNELLNPTEYLVATKGERFARNKRGRGSSDVRALMIGEWGEMDECKVSLIASAKEKGYWHSLSEDFKRALEWADEEIRVRLTILVMIDVATRMPLAWVVSDQPKAEATLELLRMATRDKTREKRIYGCDCDPMPAMGLGIVRNDNGTGLRNAAVKTALLGAAAANVDVRTFASADKPFIERMFGTTESLLWKLVQGYTGRKAGELPAYDAKANGVLDIDQLYEILTKFMIDEYPSLRHMGVGMGGQRPVEVFKKLNEERGIFRLLDTDQRRIHLGWKIELKPNDEGARVLSGLWYNSNGFQEAIDTWPGKVSVFLDPDDLNEATAIIPGRSDVFRLQLQTTAFADLTASEFLNLMEEYRREDPETTILYEDRIAKVRRQRFDKLKKIGVERRLSRSYVTIEEAKAKARVLFASSRMERTQGPSGTVRPGSITARNQNHGVFQIGGGDLIEHSPASPAPTIPIAAEEISDDTEGKSSVKTPAKIKKSKRLGRPTQEGKFS